MYNRFYPKEIAQEATIDRIIFKNKDFNIILFNTDIGIISVKNCFGNFYEGQKLWLEATLDGSEKYPNTYACKKLGEKQSFKISSDDIFNYLSSILGEKTLGVLEDNFTDKEMVEILENKLGDKLIAINGIGEATASKIIEAFESYSDYDLAFSKLGHKYNLSMQMIRKIVDHFKKNPQYAIQMIDDNPYNMTKVKGIGFKKADSSYLSYHNHSLESLCSPERIEAYIEYLFEQTEIAGSSYLLTDELVQNVLDNIQGAKLSKIIEVFNASEKFDSIIDGNNVKRLYLKPIFEKEKFIAQKLSEMLGTKPTELKNVDEIVNNSEKTNGYPFSDGQKLAIKNMLSNNVFLLQGFAGTGKTTSVSAFTSILAHNNMSFIQCCISGKAADNLRKATGFPSCTIASLLLMPILDFDCIIIDEISMVDLNSFYKLLSLIKPNTRIIMMGDSAQLDAIGIGVMNGMIESGKIPTIVLDKIHRQAENSAIITHSLEMRKGNPHKDLKLVKEKMITYGQNQDLSYIFVESKEEDKILNIALKLFKKYVNEVGVDEVQILCATKSTGKVSVAKLNEYAQLIANPKNPLLKEIEIKNEESSYTLREGDRVINVVNAKEGKGVSKPIFNGNTGVIKLIEFDIGMEIEFDGIGLVVVEKHLWKNIQLGYAMTTHKSQGSTIKNIIVALPFHYMLNSREMIYTAITRASKKATVITSPRSFKRSLSITSKKITKTNLSLLIKGEY